MLLPMDQLDPNLVPLLSELCSVSAVDALVQFLSRSFVHS